MSLIPHDDLVRNALAFVLEARTERPGEPLSRLLDEAGMRYNLSPLDSERLSRLLREESAPCADTQQDSTGKNA